MLSAATMAISPPGKRAALRTSIETLPGNCALRFLVVVDAHHMGSADRSQAPSIPHPRLVAPRHITGLVERAEQRFVRLAPAGAFRVQAANKCRAASAKRQRGVFRRELSRDQCVKGQPDSLTDGNALSPGTTASCL